MKVEANNDAWPIIVDLCTLVTLRPQKFEAQNPGKSECQKIGPVESVDTDDWTVRLSDSLDGPSDI